MTRIVVGVLALLTLSVPGTPAAAQPPAAPAGPTAAGTTGTVQKITVHGRSLEGNLAGDSPDRDVFVYLPPSYATSPNRRYPVAYLLHGYGLTGEAWMKFANIAAAADAAIAGGTRELIVVNPDAFNKWSGSMYAASPTIGDWETFVAEDLVAYIDTIAAKYWANSPLAMVDQYLTNLRKYKAIALEIGDQDTLFASNRQLSDSLTNLGLTHGYAVYGGDHTNRVPQRIQEHVLPFFGANLAAAR